MAMRGNKRDFGLRSHLRTAPIDSFGDTNHFATHRIFPNEPSTHLGLGRVSG